MPNINTTMYTSTLIHQHDITCNIQRRKYIHFNCTLLLWQTLHGVVLRGMPMHIAQPLPSILLNIESMLFCEDVQDTLHPLRPSQIFSDGCLHAPNRSKPWSHCQPTLGVETSNSQPSTSQLGQLFWVFLLSHTMFLLHELHAHTFGWCAYLSYVCDGFFLLCFGHRRLRTQISSFAPQTTRKHLNLLGHHLLSHLLADSCQKCRICEVMRCLQS